MNNATVITDIVKMSPHNQFICQNLFQKMSNEERQNPKISVPGLGTTVVKGTLLLGSAPPSCNPCNKATSNKMIKESQHNYNDDHR